MLQQSDRQSAFGKAIPIALVALVLLLGLAIINPFREMLAHDDSWTYALMARYTLATGKYHLHRYTVVNLPVQIYLAAGLSKLFGFSFILLRCMTLVFLFLALGCFYLILRELGHSRELAGCITLVFLASPLVLILSLAFMTDIPFLGWVLLALLLYLRALRQQSARLAFLGSIAAACAIGTRQFGIVLLIGLAACWALSARGRRPTLRLIASAGIIPLLAGIVQIYVGLKYPNPTQQASIIRMHAFYRSGILAVTHEYFWRCCVILQYVGIGLLPLAPFLFALRRSSLKERFGRVPIWVIGLFACAVVCFALSLSSFHTARSPAKHHGLWTPLELDWVLPVNFSPLPLVMRLLDTSGIIGAATLVILFARELKLVAHSRGLSTEALLLFGTGLGFLVMYLSFNQLNDTYTVDLFPFALLIVADILRRSPPIARLFRASAVLSITLIIALAFWLRAEYAGQEAGWKSAETLYRSGVQPVDIFAPIQWSMYNGTYDEWIASGSKLGFDDWWDERMLQKRYRIWNEAAPVAPTGWKLLAVRSYRNALFQRRYVLTLERDVSSGS